MVVVATVAAAAVGGLDLDLGLGVDVVNKELDEEVLSAAPFTRTGWLLSCCSAPDTTAAKKDIPFAAMPIECVMPTLPDAGPVPAPPAPMPKSFAFAAINVD